MSLIFVVVMLIYGIYSGNVWPAVLSFIVFVVEDSVWRIIKPAEETKLDEMKAELDSIKLELNSIKFRSMK